MGAVAAIIIREEKEIVRAFRGAGATKAERSASTSDLHVDERQAFQILRRRGVLRETTPGHYYLDEVAWEGLRLRRKRLLYVVMALALTAIAVAYFVTARRTQ